MHIYQMHHVVLCWSESRFTLVLQYVYVMAVSLCNVERGAYSNRSEAEMQVSGAAWSAAAHLIFSVASPRFKVAQREAV